MPPAPEPKATAQPTLAALTRRLFADRSAPFRHVLDELARPSPKTLLLQNLPGSSLALVLATVLERQPRTVLVLTAGSDRAADLVDDLEFFGITSALHYPKWEVLPYDQESLDVEVTAKQLDVLEALREARSGRLKDLVVAAPADALMQRVLPAVEYDARSIRVEWGQAIPQAQLVERLMRAGYDREPVVEARGEFSVRGNIIDVYPMNGFDAMRLDFFGDEIESIRVFDVQTQRSMRDLGTGAVVVVPPARLKESAEDCVRSGGALVPFADLLPEGTLVLLDNPERHAETCAFFEGTVQRQYHDVLKESPDLPPPASLILSQSELHRSLERFRRVEHSELPIESLDKAVVRVPFDTRSLVASTNDIDGWGPALHKLQENDTLVVVACDNPGQEERLQELLRERQVRTRIVENPGASIDADAVRGRPDVMLTVGRLSSGFHVPGALVGFLTDREMFGRYRRRTVYKKIYKGRPISSASDIQRNDYVVHVEHGIGRYLGMRQQLIDGRLVDLIEILYDGNDKLLVPVEKIRFVQKYGNADGAEPQLDRLGGGKWQKRRKKSSEEVEKIANELLALYARREAARRKDYGPDTNMMREFEASFIYAETPDQLAAIRAVKEDMESGKPMDRLVCGDVGYGKTEVAIRAVMKCVQGGRQAAVLCPTTILAQQHYLNLRERFADYPVKIDWVSRFKTTKEVKDVLARAKGGALDVVVGTHRLLSADVKFLDLGVLVIDEEHRFGVKSKEKIKELRADVDVLTLSATPIPRTLHMALSGIRDFSLITTPPPDRVPIKTKIIRFEEEQIAEAILRELNRGGQVYFVHNRVATIAEVCERLRQIVPHARILVGHGQMKEEELEEVMLKFIEHQADILVATTIIESGLDIPNCNTIIINRADALGLSQLYQLRGRVGREKRRAYAYLIVPPGEAITEAAVKRLAAIEEFSELGSGFNIAMRDMEIRGTGNLLGKEQHGTISDIGFELYCEMLRDAVTRIRGGDVESDRDIEIKAELSSVIPPLYVPVESQRLTFYKRFAVAREAKDLDDIIRELRDRYGEAPEPVQALIAVTRLRLACRQVGLGGIQQRGPIVRATFVAPEAPLWLPDIQEALRTEKRIAHARAEGADTVVLMMQPGLGAMQIIDAVTAMLALIRDKA